MYLERLEIQGFKSFAHKNKLVFPGIISGTRRGITAIVGPNGSGKSNTADAVRWALGEQSIKTLRGKKSDDVIFSGSDQKSRLGMAEVSLCLNNSGVQAKMGLEKQEPESENYIDTLLTLPEIVITRRIFRDGDSEYLINNSRVRLTDIQMLLAKANFGQKTYSVIGQGMVEGFLNTSLAERKDFFDEATGVKQYQIKRDIALNKLQNSYENLTQVEILLNEIEPRLKSLTRQVHKLERRSEIEVELTNLQISYYRQLWHEIDDKFNEFNSQYLELEKVKMNKDGKLTAINSELEKQSLGDESSRRHEELQKQLTNLGNDRDDIIKKVNKLEAWMEARLEASGQFDLSFLSNKRKELEREVIDLDNEMADLENSFKPDNEKAARLSQEKNSLTNRIADLNQELLKITAGSGNSDMEKINSRLARSLEKLEAAELELDLEKIRQALREIKEELQEVMSLTTGASQQALVAKIQADLADLANQKELLMEQANAINLEISRRQERKNILGDKQVKVKAELAEIEKKLSQSQDKFDAAGSKREQEDLNSQLAAINGQIQVTKDQISQLNNEQLASRGQLFETQKQAQILQAEINNINNELNDIKVSATRYETRLEDLEAEMRQIFTSLRDIKEVRNEAAVEIEPLGERISQLKKQLEMIGGIDPEVTKEYETTKERYDFLFTQTNDLNDAIKSLEKIIYELDLTIKERFDAEFKVISEKFSEYFKILFNGGSAKIVKVMATDEEIKDEKKAEGDGSITGDEYEKTITLNQKQVEYNNLSKIKFLKKHNATGLAGIEIEATPPGKKIKSVSMLSGGERALTAIALISAIISANPSPFVVLDEVDAALDEANSERLAKILDDLSSKTQFIVITHNRASMRKASILYGVTMQADGISQLLSVKLDEVKLD